MDDFRSIPPQHPTDAQLRRSEQTQHFRRNQTIGLLLVALAVVIWRLFHSHIGWLFPQGWWRP